MEGRGGRARGEHDGLRGLSIRRLSITVGNLLGDDADLSRRDDNLRMSFGVGLKSKRISI